MRILHVVASVNRETGGPAFSVTRLAAEQAKLGHEVTVAALDYERHGPAVDPAPAKLDLTKADFLAVHGRGWSPTFVRRIRELARNADVVHNHALWMWPNKYARCAAKKAGKPLVISTRGMLEGWSLGRSVGRKFVAWHLFERKNLESAALFHATSESEAEAIATALRSKLRSKYGELSVKGDRRWEIGDRGTDSAGGGRWKVEGDRQVRIVVAPNGVDVPERIPGREVVERKFPRLKGKEWVLFMSRIHPKKGIDLLLHAWREQMTVRGQVEGGRRPSFAPNLASSGGASEGFGVDPRICNFGGGVKNSCSLAQLSEWCEKRFGARKVESDPKPRPYDLPWVVLDSTRAKRLWGFEVRTLLEQIFEEIAGS